MPPGVAGDGNLDAPRRVAVPRRLRPARPQPGPALRTDQRHDGRAGSAPDERAELHRKVTSDEGRAAQLAASEKTPRAIVEELYLRVYSRFPTAEESARLRTSLRPDQANRRQATEDLMWALLNTPEFVFKD